MSTDTHQKIRADHLKRDAFLYVRQSSLRQVFENTESSKRQYGLRERAVALGWPIERIHTIDSDLGISGSSANNRDGFQQLVSQVALGRAGIVLGLEVSRLARNNADWHRLLELAALAQTLILDEDGIYDPVHFNDRLLLGLKGTMSEAELHVLKARLIGGQRNKARCGELQMMPPIGLAYDSLGAVVLDHDEQVRATVQMIFDSFRQVGTACAVVRRFQREGLQFPRRVRRGIGKGDLLWGTLDHSRVIQILHNPRYTGAFVYGRYKTVPSLSAKRTTRVLKVAREDWTVLIQNVHPGYITWEEFERNQVTLKGNIGSFSPSGRGTVPREGRALLQGRLVCGICGARMRVKYQAVEAGLLPYYQCTEESVRRGGKVCQSIRGSDIDAAIGALLLETVAPAALKVALAVQDEIAGRIEQADALRRKQLERARYEAELARRRYVKVDPDNRLVADRLEADWNEHLRRLDTLQQEHEQQRKADQGLLSAEARARILALSKDFPRVWNDPRTEAVERKRMVALLIEDVTLIRGQKIDIHVRFRGGQTTSLMVDRPKPMALVRKTLPAVVSKLDHLLNTCSDREAAVQLNALGHRNWKGEAFTTKRAAYVRQMYGLKSRFDRLRARGFLTGKEVAQQLHICITRVHDLGREGILPRTSYGNEERRLYKPINGAVLVNGRGGRGNTTRPRLIPAPSSTQEVV